MPLCAGKRNIQGVDADNHVAAIVLEGTGSSHHTRCMVGVNCFGNGMGLPALGEAVEAGLVCSVGGAWL
jgi:hypothetical protein